jgi:hypothetical protein
MSPTCKLQPTWQRCIEWKGRHSVLEMIQIQLSLAKVIFYFSNDRNNTELKNK